jgi:glycosyltransferase involved in cell wall biosynthesis
MATLITDDIVIVDNQRDNTADTALQHGYRVYHKHKGIALAKYDWILSIDADEIPDMALIIPLHDLKLSSAEIVYDVKFKSYFGKKLIRFGNGVAIITSVFLTAN